jgi:signal transduction histidine kinase
MTPRTVALHPSPTHPRARRRSWRIRLALLYCSAFMASGIVLLGFINLLLWTGKASLHKASPDTGHLPAGSTLTANPGGTNLDQLLTYSGIALLIMIPLSFALGWFLAGRVVRPLRTIVAAARKISAGNLHERLNLDAPYDEFAELGQTLDELFGRLEASFQSQQHFVANASHELRTPLTVERTLLQVALADPNSTVENLRATCEQLLVIGAQQERLIEAILTLATSDRGIEQWEAVDLAKVAQNVVQARRAEAGRHGIQIKVALAAATTTGDPHLIESLIANLIDNAVRHNSTHGHVEITTSTSAGDAVLMVSNTGPVIKARDLDRMFQPFQRLGDARVHHEAGVGLGLAIVKTITGAHDATLTAKAQPAGGLEIRIRFPAAKPVL